MGSIPRWYYYVLAFIAALLLLIAIIFEPFANKDELPYYHPPGQPPSVSPFSTGR